MTKIKHKTAVCSKKFNSTKEASNSPHYEAIKEVLSTELQDDTEKDVRFRALRREYKKTNDTSLEHLIDKLQSCSNSTPCGSLACPVCNRQRQLMLTTEMAETFQGKTVLHLTLIAVKKADNLISVEDLASFPAKRISNNLVKQIDRNPDLNNVYGYISTEFSYNNRFDAFVPHIHALLAGCSENQLKKALKKHYPDYEYTINDMPVDAHDLCEYEDAYEARHETRRIKALDTKEWGGEISLLTYPTKLKTYGYYCYINEYGELVNSRKKRPNDHIHNQHLLYLENHKSEDFFRRFHIKAC